MEHSFLCTCHYPSGRTGRWPGTWSEAGKFENLLELHVSGRSSLFTVIFGRSSAGNWVCVPELGIGASLSHFSDVFWNFEKLSRLTSRTDAATIVYALADYEKEHRL